MATVIEWRAEDVATQRELIRRKIWLAWVEKKSSKCKKQWKKLEVDERELDARLRNLDFLRKLWKFLLRNENMAGKGFAEFRLNYALNHMCQSKYNGPFSAGKISRRRIFLRACLFVTRRHVMNVNYGWAEKKRLYACVDESAAKPGRVYNNGTTVPFFFLARI